MLVGRAKPNRVGIVARAGGSNRTDSDHRRSCSSTLGALVLAQGTWPGRPRGSGVTQPADSSTT
eukprot:8480255-Pyramimonas_sp.AAC.1